MMYYWTCTEADIKRSYRYLFETPHASAIIASLRCFSANFRDMRIEDLLRVQSVVSVGSSQNARSAPDASQSADQEEEDDAPNHDAVNDQSDGSSDSEDDDTVEEDSGTFRFAQGLRKALKLVNFARTRGIDVYKRENPAHPETIQSLMNQGHTKKAALLKVHSRQWKALNDDEKTRYNSKAKEMTKDLVQRNTSHLSDVSKD